MKSGKQVSGRVSQNLGKVLMLLLPQPGQGCLSFFGGKMRRISKIIGFPDKTVECQNHRPQGWRQQAGHWESLVGGLLA